MQYAQDHYSVHGIHVVSRQVQCTEDNSSQHSIHAVSRGSKTIHMSPGMYTGTVCTVNAVSRHVNLHSLHSIHAISRHVQCTEDH